MIVINKLTTIGGPESRYALTWKHASEELWEELWMFDPSRAIPRLLALIFKKRITDTLANNPYIGWQ